MAWGSSSCSKITCCVTLRKLLNSVHPNSFFLSNTGSDTDIYLFMGVVSTRNPGMNALDKFYFKKMQANFYSSSFHLFISIKISHWPYFQQPTCQMLSFLSPWWLDIMQELFQHQSCKPLLSQLNLACCCLSDVHPAVPGLLSPIRRMMGQKLISNTINSHEAMVGLRLRGTC